MYKNPITRMAYVFFALSLIVTPSFAALTLSKVSGYSSSIYGLGNAGSAQIIIEDDSVESLRGQTIVTRAPESGEAGWSLEYLVLRYFDYTNTRTLGPSDIWEVTIVEWQPSSDVNDSIAWESGTAVDPLAGFSSPKVILQDSGSFAVDTDFFRIDHLKLTLETAVFIEAEKSYGVYFTNKNSNGESFQVTGSQANSIVSGAMILQLDGQSPVMVSGADLAVNLHGTASAAPDDRDIAPRFELGDDIELPLNSASYSDPHVTEFNAHNDGQSLVGYTVTSDNSALFSSQPVIDNAGVLTFTPNVDTHGAAIVTIYVTDSGATNNESLRKTFTITITDRPAQVVYVDASTPAEVDVQDGKTWETAFEDLQDALASAVELDEIWVAQGVYYPDQAAAGVANVSAGNRSKRFELLENVPVYGGFAGVETSLDERLPKVNVTILSGDIDQNDIKVNSVVIDNPTDNIKGNNSYGVVKVSESIHPILDGFTITGSSISCGYQGGGTLTNCVIQGNKGSTGGIYAYSTTLVLIDCELTSNTSSSSVGGLRLYDVDLTMIGCRVQGNLSTAAGNYSAGGMQLSGGDSVLINCLIAGNSGGIGGGILLDGGDNDGGPVGALLSIQNSTVTGNYAASLLADTAGGVASLSDSSTLNVLNSIIWNNDSPVNSDASGITIQSASLVGGYNPGGTNLDGTDALNDPDFITPIVTSSAVSTSGDFRLLDTSPVISAGQVSDLGADVADLDLDADISEALPYDIDQNARVVSTLDLGAFEYVGAYSALDFYRGSVGLDTDGSEDNADSSGNGVENILYYAFAMGDPLQAHVSYVDPDSAQPGLPAAAIDAATNRYQLTYVRPASASAGLTVVVECSIDFSDWVDVLELTGEDTIQETNVLLLDDDYELVTVDFLVGSEGGFYRARIEVD